MRVQYYISSLLIIAILGTVAVGGTVGVMLRKEQLRVLSSGQASDIYKRVQSLRTNSDELLAVMDILTTESSGVFVIVDRLVIRCRADLEHIAKEFPPESTRLMKRTITAFDEMLYAGSSAALASNPDGQDKRFAKYDKSARAYLDFVEMIEEQAGELAREQSAELTAIRATNRAFFLGLAGVMLLLIAAARRWTTRSVVSPIKNLADAANRALTNCEALNLEIKGPSEIRSLTASISAFVNSLEKRVQHRTAALDEANGQLKREVAERKRAQAEREAMESELMAASRRSGMAEIATNVLHNVGNVLNSVNLSATVVTDKVRKSPVKDFEELAALLDKHADDLGEFVTTDAKGKMVPQFLQELARHLANSQAATIAELDRLVERVDHLKEIVNTQQSYARVSNFEEDVSLVGIVEDALEMNSAAYERHDVAVERDFAELPNVRVDRHKVLQILTNLISNAKYAVSETGRDNGKVLVRLTKDEENDQMVCIQVRDNGGGIAKENITKIFTYGFTTRKAGHGFGLHSAANAAKELGGSLSAQSDGPGRGATFTLSFPLALVEVPA